MRQARLPMRTTTAPRRSARPGQRSDSRRWRWLVQFLLAGLLITLGVGAWRCHPRQLLCETTAHTYCPTAVEQALQPLLNTPWWQMPQRWIPLIGQIKAGHPDIVQLRWQYTGLNSLQVWLEQSPIITSVQFRDGSLWQLHAHGQLSTAPATATTLFWFPQPNDWFEHQEQRWQIRPERWNDTIQSNWQKMAQEDWTGWPLPVQKIEIVSPQEIYLTFASGQRAIMRLDTAEAWSKQRNTLQAFFHSTTITSTWQEIDVRFHDIVIR